MRNNNESLLADFFLMAFLFLVFISIIFVVETPAYKEIHILVLGGIFFICIFTYFTSLTTGLMIAISIDFIVLSLYLYMSLTKSIPIKEIIYFWVIMLPLFVITLGNFTNKVIQLQKTNGVLEQQVKELITLDEQTGLRNHTAFMYDTLAYMNIAQRYEHELVFMVVGLKYPGEIKRMIGNEKMQQIIGDISNILEASMRKEDIVYIIDREKALWGILMITNHEQGMIQVNQRVRDKVNQLHVEGRKKGRPIKIDLVIGQSLYNSSMESPIELLESAKRQMQYDV